MVADLEDAVAPAEKPAAREVVARLKPPRSCGSTARTRNGSRTTSRSSAELELDALVLPKATPEAAPRSARGGRR